MGSFFLGHFQWGDCCRVPRIEGAWNEGGKETFDLADTYLSNCRANPFEKKKQEEFAIDRSLT